MSLATPKNRCETFLRLPAAQSLSNLAAVIVIHLASSSVLAVVWATILEYKVIPDHDLHDAAASTLIPDLVAAPLINTFLVAFIGSALVSMFARNDSLGLSIVLTPALLAALFAMSAVPRGFTVQTLLTLWLCALWRLERRHKLENYFASVVSQMLGNVRLICAAVVGVWFARII